MIRVLVVDDSLCAQYLLRRVLDADRDIEVVGTAHGGKEAVALSSQLNPDVITMDLRMPGMDGLEATREIMATKPVPIIIVSTDVEDDETSLAFDFINAGAVSAVGKPVSVSSPNFGELCFQLIRTVKHMSGVKLVRRRAMPESSVRRSITPSTFAGVIAIGASTGGPPVLQEIFSGITCANMPPFLVVQHMASGFLPGLVRWLQTCTALKIVIGQPGMIVQRGHVYFAPDDVHMGIGTDGKITVSSAAKEYQVRPSAAHLFRSVARAYGSNAVGAILTGMGADGAIELGLMKQSGAVTIAQSPETCVVDGMPGSAIKSCCVSRIMDPWEMVEFFNQFAGVPDRERPALLSSETA